MQWLFLLGVVTGMRTMTAMAVVCWFAYEGRLPVHEWAFWAAYLAAVIVFTLFALGEYVGDTLPKTPNRTAPGPAVSRFLFGGLAGALAANSMHQPVAGGVILALLGVAVGTWGGIRVRAWLARALGRDLPAALSESAVALGLAVWAAHELARGVTHDALWWS